MCVPIYGTEHMHIYIYSRDEKPVSVLVTDEARTAVVRIHMHTHTSHSLTATYGIIIGQWWWACNKFRAQTIPTKQQTPCSTVHAAHQPSPRHTYEWHLPCSILYAANTQLYAIVGRMNDRVVCCGTYSVTEKYGMHKCFVLAHVVENLLRALLSAFIYACSAARRDTSIYIQCAASTAIYLLCYELKRTAAGSTNNVSSLCICVVVVRRDFVHGYDVCMVLGKCQKEEIQRKIDT